MSFNYDPELKDDVSWVRFSLGDKDPDHPLCQDEEISAVLTDNNGEILESAAVMAESLAAQFARMVNISIDGASWQQGNRAAQFSALARRLRASASFDEVAPPLVTGVSVSDMTAVDNDPDRVPSQFKIGQFDNPPREGGGQPGVGGENTTTTTDLI